MGARLRAGLEDIARRPWSATSGARVAARDRTRQRTRRPSDASPPRSTRLPSCRYGLEHGLFLYSRRQNGGRFGDWLMVAPPLVIDETNAMNSSTGSRRRSVPPPTKSCPPLPASSSRLWGGCGRSSVSNTEAGGSQRRRSRDRLVFLRHGHSDMAVELPVAERALKTRPGHRAPGVAAGRSGCQSAPPGSIRPTCPGRRSSRFGEALAVCAVGEVDGPAGATHLADRYLISSPGLTVRS